VRRNWWAPWLADARVMGYEWTMTNPTSSTADERWLARDVAVRRAAPAARTGPRTGDRLRSARRVRPGGRLRNRRTATA
jgi:hypothetical protein